MSRGWADLSLAAREGLCRIQGRQFGPFEQYVPGPPQRRFHADPARRRLLRAGNQSGKTTAGAMEAWYHALGWHPYQPVDPRPTTGLVIAADWGSYIDVVSAKMWESAPKWALKAGTDWTKGRGFKHQTLELANGSRILFRSAEQGPPAVAGLTVDWMWWDEPPTQDLWGEALSRVAVAGGPVWLTMTPVGRPVDWLQKLVEGDPTTTPPTPPTEHWAQTIIRLTPEDMPYRTAESLRAQTAGYGPWEYAQRVLGAWEGESHDRRFTSWSADLVVPLDQFPAQFDELRLGIDHGEGDRKQIGVLVGVQRQNRKAPSLWVLGEVAMEAHSSPPAFAAGVRRLLDGFTLTPWHITRAIGDINSAGLAAGGGRYNRFLEAAIATEYGTGTTPLRITDPDKRPGSVSAGEAALHHAMTESRLHVSPGCRVLTNALKHYTGPKDPTYKDPIDALRYGVADLLFDSARPTGRPIIRG